MYKIDNKQFWILDELFKSKNKTNCSSSLRLELSEFEHEPLSNFAGLEIRSLSSSWVPSSDVLECSRVSSELGPFSTSQAISVRLRASSVLNPVPHEARSSIMFTKTLKNCSSSNYFEHKSFTFCCSREPLSARRQLIDSPKSTINAANSIKFSREQLSTSKKVLTRLIIVRKCSETKQFNFIVNKRLIVFYDD